MMVLLWDIKTQKAHYGASMIDADGKMRDVRKQVLEPVTDIRQETDLFTNTGTWVAANLKIQLPTPEIHPGFSLG